MRTKSALSVSEEIGVVLLPAIRGFVLGSSTDRPRSTSKSGEKDGFAGTRASAEAISCFSSGEGAHTFSMFTFTCGFGGALASCAEQRSPAARTVVTMRILWNTAKLYQHAIRAVRQRPR